MHVYKSLKIWKKSMDVAVEIYTITNSFPPNEKYGLANQIRKAAVSIPSNIAEGAGRNSPKEFLHFLGVSRGSTNELLTQLEIAYRVGLIENENFIQAEENITHILKMNHKLQESILKKLK